MELVASKELELKEDEYVQSINGEMIVRKKINGGVLGSGLGSGLESRLVVEECERDKEEKISEFDKIMLMSAQEYAQEDILSGYESGLKMGFLSSEENEENDKDSNREEWLEYTNELKDRFMGDINWIPKVSPLSTICSKHKRELWCVKGMILIRDKGICRICGDRVRGNTWMVQKLDKEGPWAEDNCYLICGQCAICRSGREYLGSKQERMKKIKLFILKRRYKGYGGSKELNSRARSVLFRLKKDDIK